MDEIVPLMSIDHFTVPVGIELVLPPTSAVQVADDPTVTGDGLHDTVTEVGMAGVTTVTLTVTGAHMLAAGIPMLWSLTRTE
jgi:hypothetical protein